MHGRAGPHLPELQYLLQGLLLLYTHIQTVSCRSVLLDHQKISVCEAGSPQGNLQDLLQLTLSFMQECVAHDWNSDSPYQHSGISHKPTVAIPESPGRPSSFPLLLPSAPSTPKRPCTLHLRLSQPASHCKIHEDFCCRVCWTIIVTVHCIPVSQTTPTRPCTPPTHPSTSLRARHGTDVMTHCVNIAGRGNISSPPDMTTTASSCTSSVNKT